MNAVVVLLRTEQAGCSYTWVARPFEGSEATVMRLITHCIYLCLLSDLVRSFALKRSPINAETRCYTHQHEHIGICDKRRCM